MNDEQLERALQLAGKGCFVKYYEEFSDSGKTREYLIELLHVNEGYTNNSCSARVYHARRIIDSGRSKDALSSIANSQRLSKDIVEKAVEKANALLDHSSVDQPSVGAEHSSIVSRFKRATSKYFGAIRSKCWCLFGPTR